MQTVFIETSIVGYLASRMSSNLVVAGNQRLTAEWWDNHRGHFELFVSQAVIAECSAGDAEAARERLTLLDGIPILDVDDATRDLAKTLLVEIPLPSKAELDALHIAVSAINGMDYLLTWNCKHIANPSLQRRIEAVLTASDITPPVI